MGHPVPFFRPFGIVPMSHIANEVTCNAANSLEGLRRQFVTKVDILSVQINA